MVNRGRCGYGVSSRHRRATLSKPQAYRSRMRLNRFAPAISPTEQNASKWKSADHERADSYATVLARAAATGKGQFWEVSIEACSQRWAMSYGWAQQVGSSGWPWRTAKSTRPAFEGWVDPSGGSRCEHIVYALPRCRAT